MSGSRTIDKIRKRTKWPVDICGETVYVREMLNSEKREAGEIADDTTRGYYMIGTVLLEEDGSAAFERRPDETGEQFATRVKDETDDVPEHHKLLILEALGKAHVVPENLAKN